MAGETPNITLPALGWHAGSRACTELLRQGLLALAPAQPTDAPSWANVQRVCLIDPDFADWPLDELPVLAALTAWLRQGGRRLQLLGVDFETTARALPRLSRWRRDWQHAIDVFQPQAGGLPPALRGLLASPYLLQWYEAPESRMRVSCDALQTRATAAEIADFLQQCEPAWPSTTLGL